MQQVQESVAARCGGELSTPIDSIRYRCDGSPGIRWVIRGLHGDGRYYGELKIPVEPGVGTVSGSFDGILSRESRTVIAEFIEQSAEVQQPATVMPHFASLFGVQPSGESLWFVPLLYDDQRSAAPGSELPHFRNAVALLHEELQVHVQRLRAFLQNGEANEGVATSPGQSAVESMCSETAGRLNSGWVMMRSALLFALWKLHLR
jgi:hypothetical protein